MTHEKTRRITRAAALAALTLIGGCGGSGGGSSVAGSFGPPPAAPEAGEVAVTLTDAPGDFVAYIVDLESIRLRRANGELVETLPLATRIDFAQLAEVSELVTVATVPAGVYREAVLTLDFSDAEVLVQDGNGEPVAADVADTDGNPVGTLDVELVLDDDSAVRVTPRTVRAFSLDFDLAASNTVDTTTSPPRVTVEPVLLASAELEEDREHRVRGLLADVDEAAGAVTLKVRPFRHRTGSFGRFTFLVNDDTGYEIDGATYQGEAGLLALADQPEDTPVVAHGTITDGELVADTVVAGDSVYWSDANVVHGVVTARSGNTLTVSGVAAAFADGRSRFQRDLTVLVGEGTSVHAPGVDAGELDHQAISVGARVVAAGQFTDDATLDATEGRVRLPFGGLWGDVVSVSPLVVDVHLLNGRRPAAFDFSGTGVTPADDADPAAYEIDTAALGLIDLEADDLVQVRGLVNGFGAAPPDFVARTVVNVAGAAIGATAKAAWPGGSGTPFITVAPDRLDVDLSDARSVVVQHGRIRPTPLEPDALALVAPADGKGIYAVVTRGGSGNVTVYRAFADAVGALTEALDGGAVLHRLTAHGRYTDGTGELITVRASFVLESTESGAASG